MKKVCVSFSVFVFFSLLGSFMYLSVRNVEAAGSCQCYNDTTRTTSSGSCSSSGVCSCGSGLRVVNNSCSPNATAKPNPTSPPSNPNDPNSCSYNNGYTECTSTGLRVCVSGKWNSSTCTYGCSNGVCKPAPTSTPPVPSGVCPNGTYASGCLDHYDGRSWICDCFTNGKGKVCGPNEYADCSVSGTCVGTYSCNSTSTPPPGRLTPPPSSTPTAKCASIKVYSLNWTPINPEEFSNLLADSKVYFCVAGSTSAGSFDKARFTINGVLTADSTYKNPTGNEFCQIYQNPSSVYTVTVQGEIHHNTLGWL